MASRPFLPGPYNASADRRGISRTGLSQLLRQILGPQVSANARKRKASHWEAFTLFTLWRPCG